jgi:glycosyltransferase involved in cell wall biosynthesis
LDNNFENILYIGPDHKNHRGGIGAVLDVYAGYLGNFKFIPSFKAVNPLRKVLVFVGSLFKISSVLIKDKAIEVVHIHGSHGASVYRKSVIIFLAKKVFSKKVIYHLHASSFDIYYQKGSGFYKWLCNKSIKAVDVVIALSPKWYDYYNETFAPDTLITLKNVIPYPDLSTIQPSRVGGKIRFLFLGRVGDRKGIFDVLNVVKNNRQAWAGRVEIQIGGDGEVDRLKSIIANNGLEDIVKYIGWVDGTLKHKALSSADVLLLPSYNEGLPISILEALSYGVPVIASNVGGIPEVVKNQVNGFLLTPGDLPAIEHAINEMQQLNEPQFNNMKKASLEIIKDYMPDKLIVELNNLYSSIL